MKRPTIQLPVSRRARRLLEFPENRYGDNGYLKIHGPRDAREIAARYHHIDSAVHPSAADIYGASLIVTAWRLLLKQWNEDGDGHEEAALSAVRTVLNREKTDLVLAEIVSSYPTDDVWHGRATPGESVGRTTADNNGRLATLHVKTLVTLAEGNPAFAPFRGLFTNPDAPGEETLKAWEAVEAADGNQKPRLPEDDTPLSTLRRPINAAPYSIKDQLLYILTHWGALLGDWMAGIIGALDMIEEETRPRFHGPGPARGPGIHGLDGIARFSNDDDWMPRVVLLAKNVLVWLHQLSVAYGRSVKTLSDVPDEELNLMASRGFNALWLIGLWERSPASRDIKRRMGNPEAAASAYSLYGYEIAADIGGWGALENLRTRAAARGIRLSSDMVPNHVGIDSDWVRHHPERLLALEECPYPGYRFNSDDLSGDSGVDIRLEDHYYDRSDAAVVFRRADKSSGRTLYVYHGNDGTSMPWNDTAQIDFLNPEAREAVIQDILHVAKNFPIIRFDAAMVLARKHIRRLWFPAPGAGGAIPSRSEHALTDEEFDAAIPSEFWMEVVDRVAAEVPGTLLLAEAFWMMEGFFVRTLGMHRVYNSAFMNMLRDGKNGEYRSILKETLAFDPGILQRFVNFMNNPDEETAVAQFGGDDRYFAVCTLLTTLPGLPMFGHGQIEGFSEKYGMEYTRAYRDEPPNLELISRHEREIFPLLGRRSLFAGAASFRLFDLVRDDGSVAEDVYAFTNTDGWSAALVVVNNAYERAFGRLKRSAPAKNRDGGTSQEELAASLGADGFHGKDWLLLREHVSGLWFLRSTDELKEHGLGIAIDGYGRQVFLDFRWERETPDGLWAALAGELNGNGTPNPDEAIAEIRLRPIRILLNELSKLGGIGELAKAIRRGERPAWPAGELDAARTVSRLLAHHTALARAAHPDAASGGLRNLSQKQPDSALVPSVISEITRRLAAAARLWRPLSGGIRRKLNRAFPMPNALSENDGAELLALWCLMAPILEAADPKKPQEIWRFWGLGAWITESGLSGDTASAAACIESVLTAGDWMSSKPADTLTLLMSLSEIRSSCGVNFWDGTLWYDRDGWRRTVRALILTAAVSNTVNAHSRRPLKGLIRKWRKADRAAEYRLEALLKSAR